MLCVALARATYSGSLRDRANVASFRGFERYDDVSPEGISSSVVVTGIAQRRTLPASAGYPASAGIFGHSVMLGPNLSAWSGWGLPTAKVDTLFVNRRIKGTCDLLRRVIVDTSAAEVRTPWFLAVAAIERSVHQDYACQLPVSGLRALAVREVARRVADGKGIVCRNVARAEAGAAEAGLEERACLQQLLLHAVSDQLKVDRDGRGIDRQREVAAAARR